MNKIRITVPRNPKDPGDDLRVAALVRQDLWAHSSLEIDPDNPRHGTHRDAHGNAYFEFATSRPEEISPVLEKYGYAQRNVTAAVVQQDSGPECMSCGYVNGPITSAVCPKCKFRDIAACPYCKQDVARQAYLPVSGDVFQCPMCDHRVRMRLNDPLVDATGQYNQPVVVLEEAENFSHAL